MEHRWGQRHDVDVVAHITTSAGLSAKGHICSVSISGAFIRTRLPVGTLTHVRVKLTTKMHGRRLTATAAGQVVRCGTDCFAIEWCELAPAGILPLLSGVAPRAIATEQAATAPISRAAAACG
jgi:hypothetical protein